MALVIVPIHIKLFIQDYSYKKELDTVFELE